MGTTKFNGKLSRKGPIHPGSRKYYFSTPRGTDAGRGCKYINKYGLLENKDSVPISTGLATLT